MNKQDYKNQLSNLILDNTKLEKENTQLRIALCNLRDNFLDLGGDPNQLDLFDKYKNYYQI